MNQLHQYKFNILLCCFSICVGVIRRGYGIFLTMCGFIFAGRARCSCIFDGRLRLFYYSTSFAKILVGPINTPLSKRPGSVSDIKRS